MIFRFLAGILLAFVIALFLSFCSFLFVALGDDPESTRAAEPAIPYLALFLSMLSLGARTSGGGRKASWILPSFTALFFVAAWFSVRCYELVRYDFALWWRDGLLSLAWSDCFAWALTLSASLLGAACAGWLASNKDARSRLMAHAGAWLAALGVVISLQIISTVSRRGREGPYGTEIPIARGVTLKCEPVQSDGTTIRLFTYDFTANPGLRVRLYDCVVDGASPQEDSNAGYKGLALQTLVTRLESRELAGRRLLTVCNGGFFGDHGAHVANHEAPMVVDGKAFFNVDLIRPRDQAWLFGVATDERRNAGEPRFQLLEKVPWEKLATRFQTAIDGVRPLRVAGHSRELASGVGSTKLRCSRTSIGWTADCGRFYLLIVRDPDTERGSNIQKRLGMAQTGGWDVREVQEYWERMGIPNAVLFDGGNSTQLACRDKTGTMMFLESLAPYSVPIGYLRARPLQALIPMSSPALGHWGVLNYLYIEGPP